MSGMADEMAARMAADQAGAPAGEVPGSTGGAVPPAGAINTDTAQGQGPPESIPYARFKEVNDRLAGLRGYEDLAQYGYDADSLRRLASFEQQYQADPIGVWRSMATNLDLPPDVLEAINRFADAPPAVSPAEGNGPVDPTAPPPVSAEDR